MPGTMIGKDVHPEATVRSIEVRMRPNQGRQREIIVEHHVAMDCPSAVGVDTAVRWNGPRRAAGSPTVWLGVATLLRSPRHAMTCHAAADCRIS